MRRVLVDHARGRSTSKRRGVRLSLTAGEEPAGVMPPMEQVLAIDAAMDKLSAIDLRLVRVVECRYFAGLTIEETAAALGVSHTTISDDWRFARAWLSRALSSAAAACAP
jgi:RNA polymerase sigma factor (TIGR02999 family)